MLSIYPTAKSESDNSPQEPSDAEVIEFEDSYMNSMCEELGKIKRRETMLKFDLSRLNDIGKPNAVYSQYPNFYHRRTNSLRIMVAGDDGQFEQELTADEDAGRLPLLPHCAAERRSRILRNLVDGAEDEEESEADADGELNLTMSLYNTQHSANRSLNGKSCVSKSKNKKTSTYVFKKNRDGSLTRYDSRILADCVDDNANIEIADYTIRVQRDVQKNRPTSELLVSKFERLFDPKAYK